MNIERVVNDIPDDILAIIFQRISFGDRVRVKLVCKNWKRVVSQDSVLRSPEAPWLISNLKSDILDGEIELESLSDRRSYCFKLPDQLQGSVGCRYYGSSRGWVLVGVADTELLLWNPLSGSTRKLPPLTSLPFYDPETMGTNFSTHAFKRLDVFPVSERWCGVAVIFDLFYYRRGNHIALCTPQDETWILFGSNNNNNNNIEEFYYEDIMFHTRDRELYVMVHHISSLQGVRDFRANSKKNIRISNDSCEVKVHQIIIQAVTPTPVYDSRFPIGLRIQKNSAMANACLVESSITGRVMIPVACMDCFISSNIEMNGNDQVKREIRCHQTAKWQICLPPASDIDYAEELKSIGEEAIFVGRTSSFCMPAAAAAGIEADCVYFATDHAEGITWIRGRNDRPYYIIREHGVFSVQIQRMRRISSTKLRLPIKSKIDWFTPTY